MKTLIVISCLLLSGCASALYGPIHLKQSKLQSLLVEMQYSPEKYSTEELKKMICESEQLRRELKDLIREQERREYNQEFWKRAFF